MGVHIYSLNDIFDLKMLSAEKLERVYLEYQATLDIDVAMALVCLTEEEAKEAREDKTLAARMALVVAHEQSALFTKLKDLTSAENEGVRLSAIRELGRTLYAKRFKADPIDVNVNKTVYKIITREGEVVEH